MKIKRSWLLGITAALGIFILLYSLVRALTGFGFDEAFEKNMIDAIVFIALGIFIYNRKLAGDEKKEKEAKERAEQERIEQEQAASDEDAAAFEENTLK